MTEARIPMAVSLLGLTALSWVLSVLHMSGMASGSSTQLGSFGHFFPLWLTMMAAMMLPEAVTPLVTQVDERAAPAFLLSYVAVWAATGVIAYLLYQPHSTTTAGAVVLLAGAYEVSPLARHSRRQCRQGSASGLGYGIACLGATAGLMAVLLAISPMSVPWMAAITAVALLQQRLAVRWLVDIPLAAIILGLGLWILLAPSAVPGLVVRM